VNGLNETGTPVSQSIVANIQLGLPATISKLSSKMRFIDRIAPALKNAGLVRNIEQLNPFTIRASGIYAINKTGNAFGGILYIAGAARQDMAIKEGSIYKTRQDSRITVDEIDDLDYQKKLKYIDIINTYKLLDELMEEEEKPELVMVSVPLLLERADAPLETRLDVVKLYNNCKKTIENFWMKHNKKIFPFNKDGIKISSVGNRRFGAVIFGLTEENIDSIIDPIDRDIISKMPDIMPRIQEVGIKRLMTGILVKMTRTAAFRFDKLSEDNRMEPEALREFGLTGMHIKAGNATPPLLVEVIGTDWTTEDLDRLASEIISLIIFDQQKAMPIPLWYARYALKPVEVLQNGKNAILEFYKSQIREKLRNEELENIWKENLDAFES
jgi:hypothetical protein